jgi:hypothetical protein
VRPTIQHLIFALPNREARFFAELQPTYAPNSPRPRRLELLERVCRPLPTRVAHFSKKKKDKKTWLGLKGDQCEQTFYNGGWSQAQLSYGASSSYSDRADVTSFFYTIEIRTSEHFILSALWRWLRNSHV